MVWPNGASKSNVFFQIKLQRPKSRCLPLAIYESMPNGSFADGEAPELRARPACPCGFQRRCRTSQSHGGLRQYFLHLSFYGLKFFVWNVNLDRWRNLVSVELPVVITKVSCVNGRYLELQKLFALICRTDTPSRTSQDLAMVARPCRAPDVLWMNNKSVPRRTHHKTY